MSACHALTGKVHAGLGQVDEPWRDARIAFIDTETTGLNAQTDRVVEIAVVVANQGVITERQCWLVNPECEIPAESTAVHHITNEMVADAPKFFEIADSLLALMCGAQLAAYNAEFDKAFVTAEFARLEYPLVGDWLCPLILVRQFQKYKKGKSLGATAQPMNFPMPSTLLPFRRPNRAPRTVRTWQKQTLSHGHQGPSTPWLQRWGR